MRYGLINLRKMMNEKKIEPTQAMVDIGAFT